ncbi:sulfotransferase [Pelagimonas varians]|uniref:Sulfotransferase domain protein n=1 Tax=Pelagimonas varians TaxID=696760 RepID=A0A238L5S9_9RHOB|nr:sulfotransferase [Pelagimonas varians]PYG25488.1 sulfotransferase family protein [Pelagimonas varians]SMX50347.1 hypothetical protein PEV8663_04604 [Pelagimonas varians]
MEPASSPPNSPRNLIILALRRSGTTALWRTLRQDPGQTCYDEPFSMLLRDLSANNHKHTWDEFLALRDRDPAAWAACFAPIPRPEEVTPGLTPDQAAYLRYLCADGPVALDETRMTAKLPAIAQVQPDAVVLHLYRHPAAFVSSHMIASQNKAPLRQKLHQIGFFLRPSYFDSWGMEQLYRDPILPKTKALMQTAGVIAPRATAPAIHKLMAMWLASRRTLERDGSALYGERFISLSFEDFCARPQAHLDRIYALADRPPLTFDTSKLHSADPGFRPGDPRWRRAAQAVGFSEAELALFFPQS